MACILNRMKPIETNVAGKQYKLALVFSFFLGVFGVDRFYLGKTGTGIIKLLTFGGLGVWYVIDVYLIAHGKLKGEGEVALSGGGDPDGTIRLFATIFLIVQLAGYAVYLLVVIAFMIFAATGTLHNTDSMQDAPLYNVPKDSFSSHQL